MALYDSLVILSSSPEFPSICELVPKPVKNPLRSGRHAAPVPEDAPTTFTSAAEIWKSQRPADPETGNAPSIEDMEAPTTEAKTDSKSPKATSRQANLDITRKRTKKAASAKSANPPGQHPIGSSDMAPPEPSNAAAPTKPPKKPRASKKKTDTSQTTLPKGNVTKPAAKDDQAKRNSETVSRHFAVQEAAPAPPSAPTSAASDPVILEQALPRRTDWTPPRETVPCALANSATKELSSPTTTAGPSIFKTLHDDYGCTADVQPSGPVYSDVLGKRKLIETVSVSSRQRTPEPSPVKSKAVKKKPRTITELATAAYRQAGASDASIGGSRDGSASAGGSEQLNGGNAAGKGKTAKKPSKPKANAGKETSKPRLLSPTSAMRQVAKQDFVFGTASQLAAEEDPELLRALHEAMKASNQPDSDPFECSSPIVGDLAIRRKGRGGLWAAGARLDGDVMDLEVIDLTGSSPLSLARALEQNTTTQDEKIESVMKDFDINMSDGLREPSISPPARAASPTLPVVTSGPEIIEIEDSSLFITTRPTTPPLQPEFEPPPSNQQQLMMSQPNSPQLQPPRPNFELYTDARLAKEVASYGFKPVKKRTGMIALLNKCWESQHQTSLGTTLRQCAMSTTAANAAGSPKAKGRSKKQTQPKASAKSTEGAGPSDEQPAAPQTPRRRGRQAKSALEETERQAPYQEPDPAPTKKPRGRPRKDVAVTTTKTSRKALSPKRVAAAAKVSSRPVTIKIPDSDVEDSIPSTPSSTCSQDLDEDDDIFSSPRGVDLSVTEDLDSPSADNDLAPTSGEEDLFRCITQAIITAPRSSDPSNPNWHEKMLMYDPVILEDLTAWLNAGQLDRVGYDGEVSPELVKKWCESKSVCCLWRENLRGKERKRL
jgi:hypothetical protein